MLKNLMRLKKVQFQKFPRNPAPWKSGRAGSSSTGRTGNDKNSSQGFVEGRSTRDRKEWNEKNEYEGFFLSLIWMT